jgi:hypothetical protein
MLRTNIPKRKADVPTSTIDVDQSAIVSISRSLLV